MIVYGDRFNEVIESHKKMKKQYHPEKYMKFIVDKYNIPIKNINFKAKRVRSNGNFVNEKF